MTRRIHAPDTDADSELKELLDAEPLQCFIMIAGAGSGKTTSLVKALSHIVAKHGSRLSARTQQVACITYTEVAAKEIHSDVGNSPLIFVSTIHSFLWSLIKGFHRDISAWVQRHLEREIQQIIEKQKSYSSRTKNTTIEKDLSSLHKLQSQLKIIPSIKKFSYGVGSDYTKGVLGHEDIIRMTPEVIKESKLFRRIIAKKYPYIFVDESQDTFPEVIEALKSIGTQAKNSVCLGFFGDPMQQIYQRSVGPISPEPDWRTIEKPENFRSSRRVLEVINQVRFQADGLVQISGLDKEKQPEGEAFFFVLPADCERNSQLKRVREWLSVHSTSGSWASDTKGSADGAKILMIVHRMVAKEMGFEELYKAFHDSNSKSLKLGFEEGSAWPLRPFREVIIPICNVVSIKSPSIIRILRQHSTVLSSDVTHQSFKDRLAIAREAVLRLRRIMDSGGPGSVRNALELVIQEGLVSADPRFHSYLYPDETDEPTALPLTTVEVLDSFMACDIAEVRPYCEYIDEQSPYSTQHGTKGAEFPKVIVVLDDMEANYSLYSYEKLLGIRELSDIDIKNMSSGKDSVLGRTRRLFYVCVSRAINSLAVVIFASDPAVAKTAIEQSGISAEAKVLTIDDIADENS